MKNSELSILRALNQAPQESHFDNYADAYKDVGGQNTTARLVPQKGNPIFAAQFSLQSLTLLYTVVTGTGVFTAANFSTLPAGLQTQAIFAFFGVNDFYSGYAKVQGLLPLSGGWAYGTPFVFGRDQAVINVNNVNVFLDTTVKGALKPGDVVIPITAVSGSNWVMLCVHRCGQVEYGGLLQASVSNSFNQKGVRYNVVDTSNPGLLQLNQQLYNFERSWLGRFFYDSTDLIGNKQPTNFQNGIVDVALTMGITKSTGIASYVNLAGYASTLTTTNQITINLSVFANNVQNPQT